MLLKSERLFLCSPFLGTLRLGGRRFPINKNGVFFECLKNMGDVVDCECGDSL